MGETDTQAKVNDKSKIITNKKFPVNLEYDKKMKSKKYRGKRRNPAQSTGN